MSTCAQLQNLPQPVQVLLQHLYTTSASTNSNRPLVQSKVHAHAHEVSLKVGNVRFEKEKCEIWGREMYNLEM